MRRTQPRHAAAFLVDQDRRILAPDAAAQRSDQLAHLLGRTAVAPEQNEAGGTRGGEEIAFEGAETLPGAAQHNRKRCPIGQ